MRIQSELRDSINQFLATCPARYDFPAGGNIGLPMEAELALVRALRRWPPVRRSDFNELHTPLSVTQAYSFVIFAVRMSIYSVRTGDPQFLTAAAPALAFDDDIVDWRDILKALSIFEECARRLGLDALMMLNDVAKLASDERQGTIRDAYLSRSMEMRNTNTMGLIVTEQDGELCVRNR